MTKIKKCPTCDRKMLFIVGENVVEKDCIMKKPSPSWMTCIIYDDGKELVKKCAANA